MGHKKGKRKREMEAIKRATGLDEFSDDESFPFGELGVAVVSGKCPQCGFGLEKTVSEDEWGLSCGNCLWSAGWSDDFGFIIFGSRWESLKVRWR